MSKRRARLPRITREEQGYRNAIAQAPSPIRFALPGGDWTLLLEPREAPAPSGEAVRIDADWGGARVAVDVPRDAVGRLIRHVVPEADAAELPEELCLAALEVARADLERALGGRAGGRPLRLEALGRPDGDVPPHRFAFTMTSAATGEAIAGRLATDASGLGFAAPLLKAAQPKERPAEPAGWIDDVPVALRFQVGATTIDRAELATAEPGDLVLLDECALTPGGELVVAASPSLGFRASLEAHRLTVTQPLGTLMAENQASAPAADAAERLPVRLTFDLGERTMTVAELRALKPGYTFDLGRDLKRAVTIRAQGQPIGEGELVEIDGTLGVAITSLGAAPAGR